MAAEKEVVRRERFAFEAGAHWFYTHDAVPQRVGGILDLVSEKAATMYPLPKIERPRVVTEPNGSSWRVIDGAIQWRFERSSHAQWNGLSTGMYITTDRVRFLADLLANPTEMVEDGDA